MRKVRQIVSVGVERLREHPGNPNVMNEAMFKKLIRHIKKSGNYEPVVVRDDPSEKGCYQILNGHHRVKALKELGYGQVDCVVWQVDDEEALVLLATLNRLAGSDGLFKKSELIKQLSQSMDVKEIVKLLPETKGSVERLKAMESVKPVVCEDDGLGLLPMVFFLGAGQRECVDEAMAVATKIEGNENVSNKKAAGLVTICREYIDGKTESN